MPPEQLTLGFDTSAAHCAAALLSGDRIIAQQSAQMHKGQAERLMPLLEEMLARAGATWRDLSRIGVGIGPGNFTGIRISVAAARGLALSLGVPAVGISQLETLAFSLPTPLLTSVDARQGRVYLQMFDKTAPVAPTLCAIDKISPEFVREGMGITGHNAAQIAEQLGAVAIVQTVPFAEALTRIAARQGVLPGVRPAPLYIRAPDAAPPRDSGPAILP